MFDDFEYLLVQSKRKKNYLSLKLELNKYLRTC